LLLGVAVALLRRRLADPVAPAGGGGFLGRGSLGRNALAGGAATLVDFVVFRGLHDGAGLWPSYATFLGCLVGAIFNFTLNRSWAFESSGPVPRMARRYAVVSGFSAVFNALGVAALLLLPGLGASAAWFLARVAVFVGLNYPLHRDYVFSPSR
jgi:putative flippase GtrA